MRRATLRVVTSVLLVAVATRAPVLAAQHAAADCLIAADASPGAQPSIGSDADPLVRHLIGDSVRIALSVNNAPPGGRISFAASGVERVVVDGGNVLRWRPLRGSEGPNYITITATRSGEVIACRQLRLMVDGAQRAPIVRIASRQVQAAGQLDFLVGAQDPDGDSLTYSATELGAGGSPVTIDSAGRFRWRAPPAGNAGTAPYQFRVEVTDGVSISAAVFSVTVSGQNVRPECPLTIATITASEGSSVTLPMRATDANGDALRFRAEREFTNGFIDSSGYHWSIPWETVETGGTERILDFQWRAIDTQNVQSDLCTTRVAVRARMEPERLRAAQEAHARFFTNALLTAQDLDTRLEEVRERMNVSDRSRRRRNIAALATALLAGTFQLAHAEDTRRWAGGLNTLTSVFFAGFNALATGTDALKADARKFEDEIARFSPLLAAFRVTHGEAVSEQVLRSAPYRADRAALDAEQARAAVLMR